MFDDTVHGVSPAGGCALAPDPDAAGMVDDTGLGGAGRRLGSAVVILFDVYGRGYRQLMCIMKAVCR